jgi:hypothetical protein
MLYWDCGNSYGKALNDGNKEMIFQSVIAKPLSTDKEDLWQVENHLIGKDAIQYGQFQNYSLYETKTEQATFRILTDYVLCNFQGDTDIVFLFPFEEYFTERKRVEEMFNKTRNISYQIGDKQYLYNFTPTKIKSLPQGFCSAMDYHLDDEGKPNKPIPTTILVVDIGFSTINMIYLNRGEIIRDKSRTTKNGMHIIYEKNPYKRKLFEVDFYDGIGSLSNLYHYMAQSVVSDVSSFYDTSVIDEILIVGGSASSLFNYFPWKQKVLHEGQMSNVRGAKKIARKLSWAM